MSRSNDIPMARKGAPSVLRDYLRGSSCTGPPQTTALSYMKSGCLTEFVDAVNEASLGDSSAPLPADHWINQPLEEEGHHTLLTAAIRKGLHNFAEVLLAAGADARLFNHQLGKAPIHVAAENGDVKSLRLLLGGTGNRADVNATLQSNGRTALHICCANRDEDTSYALLAQPDIDVNAKDLKGGQTALYLAVKQKLEGVTRALLEANADVTVQCFGKTIEEHLRAHFPDMDLSKIQRKVAPITKQVSDASMHRLVQIIERAGLEGGFTEQEAEDMRSLLLQLNSTELNSYSVAGYTLLQKAAESNVDETVGILLTEGEMNPDGLTNTVPVPPVLIAANRGNVAMLRHFLNSRANFMATSLLSEETILHVLLKRDGNDDRQAYRDCLELILDNLELKEQIKKIINTKDKNDNTPLHYATQFWSQDLVLQLLELGGSIGMKNGWGEIPVYKIEPETLEDFLDNCIQSKGDVNSKDFEVTFNYSFLAPPKEELPKEYRGGVTNVVDPEKEVLSGQCEDGNGEEKVALPETQWLYYMGQSEQHQHLLKHPVITSFLYLKWNRLRLVINRNLRFYFSFVLVLTWTIFEEFGGITKSPGQKVIPFFHHLFAVACIVLLLFILRDWILDAKELSKTIKNSDGAERGQELSCGKILPKLMLKSTVDLVLLAFLCFILFGADNDGVLRVALLILTVLLAVREILQVTVSVKRYLLSPENWLEVSIVILIAVLYGTAGNLELKRHLAAIAIVLSWAELITLIGKHPKLKRYNVYVVIFYKVMATFFFFLCWYAFFIVAFGLGFYIMLRDNSEDYKFFNSPWLTLIKTSTMFVGELEFSDIPIDVDSNLSPLAYAFFLLFVFLIVVVLMNLLNALAVSDTGKIQEEAEIWCYKSLVDTFSYTESVLLGDPLNFLSTWPALERLAGMPSCSLCRFLHSFRGPQNLFRKLFGTSDILLFYNYLPQKHLVFKPFEDTPACRHKIMTMDKTIVMSTKNVILKRKLATTGCQVLEKKISSLEEKLDLLLAKLEEKRI